MQLYGVSSYIGPGLGTFVRHVTLAIRCWQLQQDQPASRLRPRQCWLPAEDGLGPKGRHSQRTIHLGRYRSEGGSFVEARRLSSAQGQRPYGGASFRHALVTWLTAA